MPRQLDLRNDRNVTLRGVCHDVADLLLRIIPTVGRAVHTAKLRVVIADAGLRTIGGDLRQARIFLDFDAPAVILGKMPVVDVHLVARQKVDLLLNERDGIDMVSHILHDAAVGVAGLVADLGAGDRHPFAVGRGRRTHLQKRLKPVEEPRIPAAHFDSRFTDRQTVALRIGNVTSGRKGDGFLCTALSFADNGNVQTVCPGEIIPEQERLFSRRIAPIDDRNVVTRDDPELARQGRDGERGGNNPQVSIRLLRPRGGSHGARTEEQHPQRGNSGQQVLGHHLYDGICMNRNDFLIKRFSDRDYLSDGCWLCR